MAELENDTTWLRASFLAAARMPTDRQRYRMSSGWLKFMDTTLGGNTAINAPYQYTRYADIKERRLMPDVGKGMGRWYSENIDDWGHNVHFRMGTATHTGLLGFAMKSINGPAARYVATGRIPGAFSLIGKGIGFIISAAFWEITLLTMFMNNLIDALHTRFYYIKPNMAAYWATVQTILNSLSANLGITLAAERKKDNKGDMTNEVGVAGGIAGDNQLLESARMALPDTFKYPAISGMVGQYPDIGVDAFAVASRAQHLSFKFKKTLMDTMSNFNLAMSPDEMARVMEDATMGAINTPGNKNGLKGDYKHPTLESYFKAYTQNPFWGEPTNENNTGADPSEAITEIATKAGREGMDEEARSGRLKEWFQNTVDSMSNTLSNHDNRKKVDELLMAELQDGYQWCSFRVTNATNSVTESFSNSSQESEIASLFNNLSQSVRGAFFNLGGTKTGISVVDDAIGAVTGAIGDVITEATTNAFSFTNPIVGLLYGAQISIPKRWSSSSTSLPSASFDIELRCGYGNVISYYQDILFPLSMLLAMALPRGTGPQSYGPPFYVQYYSKGRSQVAIGLVSSLSITRGVGNAPWHKRGWAMGVNVSMTIEDMTDIMFSPVASALESKGIGQASLFGSPIDENAMGDYMAVLSALGMVEQDYFLPRVKRRFNNLLNNFNSWMSPDRWSIYAVDSTPGQILSKFYAATDVRKN